MYVEISRICSAMFIDKLVAYVASLRQQKRRNKLQIRSKAVIDAAAGTDSLNAFETSARAGLCVCVCVCVCVRARGACKAAWYKLFLKRLSTMQDNS